MQQLSMFLVDGMRHSFAASPPIRPYFQAPMAEHADRLSNDCAGTQKVTSGDKHRNCENLRADERCPSQSHHDVEALERNMRSKQALSLRVRSVIRRQVEKTPKWVEPAKDLAGKAGKVEDGKVYRCQDRYKSQCRLFWPGTEDQVQDAGRSAGD
ncbi:uncharacterized protein BCR38DRAFT_414341 [Pseudomassariella vexata]|uniref:Uncharacterized protein n=1 Tax=Pseudomassariella vexata TaxID=1141098 RepID=A0A1Y2DD19_9PEZI|nr:uncharacterized protein BCR38DRAFT_414341 [Pseudomassariella vexata]ORY56585.1 hypothetical protein BCR38DRAFT_414341 [Pseudomassariella vexata]